MSYDIVGHLTASLGSPRIVHDFGVWAWGSHYGMIPVNHLDDEWNKRHADELVVNATDQIKTSLEAMISVWREHDTMKKNTVQGFVTARVGAANAVGFARWAWGDGFDTAPASEFLHRWNERHGKELMLDGNKEVEIDLVKMIALWRSHGEPNVSTEPVVIVPSLHTDPALLEKLAGSPGEIRSVPNERRSLAIGTKINLVILAVVALVVGITWFVLH